MIWLALLVTLVVEVPIVAAFYAGHRLRMALACAGATTVTNLALNLVLSRTSLPYEATLVTGETVALVFEMLVYVWVAPSQQWARALAASAAANFASFAVGLLLF